VFLLWFYFSTQFRRVLTAELVPDKQVFVHSHLNLRQKIKAQDEVRIINSCFKLFTFTFLWDYQSRPDQAVLYLVHTRCLLGDQLRYRRVLFDWNIYLEPIVITTSKIHNAPRQQKIRKNAPFDLSAITLASPYFSQLLAHAVGQIRELPDFSDDAKIAVMSDFGGEHKGAHFNTYSFLILAYNKVGPFMEQVKELRRKYDLLEPYSEFAFKDLKFGPRLRALPEFLHLVDNFIHGAVITIAIEKTIDTVFGVSKRETYPIIEEQLAVMGLGKWKGADAEKVLRVCHSIAIFVALTTRENQRLLWYCDNDAINENGKERGFKHTQKIFLQTLGMYSSHKFDLIGVGKSFEDKSHLDDLLSIPDFAAGVIQDLLQAHKTGDDNVSGDEGKKALMRWIGTQGKFLSKITVQINRLANGELGSQVVSIERTASDLLGDTA